MALKERAEIFVGKNPLQNGTCILLTPKKDGIIQKLCKIFHLGTPALERLGTHAPGFSSGATIFKKHRQPELKRATSWQRHQKKHLLSSARVFLQTKATRPVCPHNKISSKRLTEIFLY